MYGGEHDPHDPWPPSWQWYAGDDDYAGGTLDGYEYMYKDDPLELEWQGEGGGGDVDGQAAAVNSNVGSSSPSTVPPSDDVMAAWLYPIVSGEGRDDDVTGVSDQAPMVMAAPTGTGRSFGTVKDSTSTISHDGSGEGRKLQAAAGSTSRTTRSSQHHSRTHSITEKRRRCKINEKLRTLQHLVPGCDKCNQASTLEQTIQYMKSLQQQLEAMKTTPAAAPAVSLYNVVRPAPPHVAAGGGAGGVLHVQPAGWSSTTTTMVPMFRGAVLPYLNYYYHHQQHAVTMPPPLDASAPAPADLRRSERSAHPSSADAEVVGLATMEE